MEYQHITAALRQRDRRAVNVARDLRRKSDIREQSAVLNAMGSDEPVTRLLLTGICFARDWQELWVKPTTPRIENSQKAANWFMVVALQHGAALQKHVRLRTQFDQTVLRGQWEIADSLLAQHKSAFGPTLWGMRWLAELKRVLDPTKVLKEGGSGFGKIMAAMRYEFKQQAKDITAYAQDAMLGVYLLCELEGIAYEGSNRR
jgi:hypothetical protein